MLVLYTVVYRSGCLVRKYVNSLLPPLPASTPTNLPILVVSPIPIPKPLPSPSDPILTNIHRPSILLAHTNLDRHLLWGPDLSALAIKLLVRSAQAYGTRDPCLCSQGPEVAPPGLLRITEGLLGKGAGDGPALERARGRAHIEDDMAAALEGGQYQTRKREGVDLVWRDQVWVLRVVWVLGPFVA